MEKNSIHIIPFEGGKEKWCMWLGKFTARSAIKEYHVLLSGAKKILVVDAGKTQEE